MTVVGDLDLSCWSLGKSLDNYLAGLPLCENCFSCRKTQGRGPSPEKLVGLPGSPEIHKPAAPERSSLAGSPNRACAPTTLGGTQPVSQ